MGQIIAFGTSGRIARRAPPRPGETGQILLFLGVRYERSEEPSPPRRGGLAKSEKNADKPPRGKKRRRG